MKRFDVLASHFPTVAVEAFYASPFALVFILLNCVKNMLTETGAPVVCVVSA